jgi:hypothetical protein
MSRRLWHIAAAVAAALAFAGCSSFASYAPPMDIASDAAARPLKDAWTPTAAVTKVAATPTAKARQQGDAVRPQTATSCKTDSECVVILSALINDPRRSWIGQPQSAAEYANGTRFFAYRALRTRLSCGELKRAIDDTKVAAARLATPALGVSVAQAASALSLSTAVGTELRHENTQRCRAAPAHTKARTLGSRDELAPG